VAYIPEVIPGEPAVRVGFAVSKRYGNAVARNRIRRQMRAAAQTLDVPLSPGAYVVRPDAGVKELSFSTLCGALAEAASRASQSGPSKR